MKKATLVIAAYKEDLGWLDNINNDELDIVIISKHTKYDVANAKLILLEDIGLCDYSFTYYLSTFYNELTDYTIFIQANPFDHYADMINFINKKEYLNGFKPLADQAIYIPPREGTDRFVEGILSYSFPGIHFPCGAQYCVTKDRILAKPKYFWDDLLNKLPWKVDWFIPYFMERCWLLIYDADIPINPNYLDTLYFNVT